MKRMLLPLVLTAALAPPVFAETVTIVRETTEAQFRIDRMFSESRSPFLSAPGHRPGDTGNTVDLQQRGNNNSAHLSQSGSGSTLRVLQVGDGGAVHYEQSGNGKRTTVLQFSR